jgi:hypothetical protein
MMGSISLWRLLEGSIPFVDLRDYGIRTRYVLGHPGESLGKRVG